MKICQMTPAETMFNFLGPLCRALVADGHVVAAACGLEFDGQVAAGYLGPDVALHRVPARRHLDRRAVTTDVVAIADYLRRERFDVLHVHGPLIGLQARIAARMAGVPVVISQAHGFYFHAGSRWIARTGLQLLEQQLARHLTDVVVTVNREDHEFAVRHRFRRDPNQLVHIPGVGVDTDRFAPDHSDAGARHRDELRASLGATGDDLVITFVGRLVGEKGLDDLADAFVEVAPRRRMVLWLVGDLLGSERDHTAPARVAGRLSDHGLADRVRFVGRRDDIPELLRASDVFVLPSLREGMPVSLLEAMATGLAVIATDIRGSREVVEDGRTGLLVPVHQPHALASALLGLHDDPGQRRALGRAARREVVTGYTVAASLAPLRYTYARLTDLAPAARPSGARTVDLAAASGQPPRPSSPAAR
ncbi:MAG TPA: glycosyltransferase family 4 protein [Egicoccus sp.]|nr:glycosyltransferase family 4 protein [Egicoccus sp.]HSK21697.1 glycosyltransferase family 4 protein [Egicoccus sp.]